VPKASHRGRRPVPRRPSAARAAASRAAQRGGSPCARSNAIGDPAGPGRVATGWNVQAVTGCSVQAVDSPTGGDTGRHSALKTLHVLGVFGGFPRFRTRFGGLRNIVLPSFDVARPLRLCGSLPAATGPQSARSAALGKRQPNSTTRSDGRQNRGIDKCRHHERT
jgi:hypothetical protein